MSATTKAKAKPPEKKKRRRIPVPASAVGMMNTLQVCDGLGGISERKLRQMVSSGEFPRPDVRLGQLVRWSVPLFNEWCRTRAGTSYGSSTGEE